MSCKALVMGDKETFDKIQNSYDPNQDKKLGRQVKNFSDNKWYNVVLDVAREECYQKFTKVPGLKKVLLDTGDALLAETTKNDDNWAIGIAIKDPRCKQPLMWSDSGNNILGWALMHARETIRNQQ